MALGDFDPNQSSIEFGQSLLADSERRRKKRKRSSKKIKNVGYLLGALKLGDLFLANKASKKVDLFKENMSAEKMSELHRITRANSFFDKQLKPLYSINASLNFEDPEQWEEGGAVWNALQTKAGTKLRSAKGTAQTVSGGWTQESYDEVTNKLASKNLKSLQNEYDRYKGTIGDTEKQLDSRYSLIVNEGIRDILSPKNTSTIRKILGKFDILNDINPELELVERGGMSIYVDKDKAATRRARLDKIEEQRIAYNEKIAETGESLTDKEIINGLIMKDKISTSRIPKITTLIEDYKTTGESFARMFYGDEWKTRDLFDEGKEGIFPLFDTEGNILALSQVTDNDGHTRFYIPEGDNNDARNIYDLFKDEMKDLQKDSFVNAVMAEARTDLNKKQDAFRKDKAAYFNESTQTWREAELSAEEQYAVIDRVLDDYISFDKKRNITVDTFDQVFKRRNPDNIHAETITKIQAFLNSNTFLKSSYEQKQKSIQL